jgi:hypothetical protein
MGSSGVAGRWWYSLTLQFYEFRHPIVKIDPTRHSSQGFATPEYQLAVGKSILKLKQSKTFFRIERPRLPWSRHGEVMNRAWIRSEGCSELWSCTRRSSPRRAGASTGPGRAVPLLGFDLLDRRDLGQSANPPMMPALSTALYAYVRSAMGRSGMLATI